MSTKDTVAAIATPPGYGGIGVVRVSGPQASIIGQQIAGEIPAAGQFSYRKLKQQDGTLIDQGLILFFEAPHSYTGEDVIEFQVHGSDIALQILLQEICLHGARQARPGEFTERAFLNDKIDLLQAEAVIDLIESKSRKAARAAVRSLQGKFSKNICSLREKVFNAKALLEAALDFPDEEDVDIDLAPVIENIDKGLLLLQELLDSLEAGSILGRGCNVVIAGRPNVGKSSLLNYLAGNDVAIVSDKPGTTRDIVRQNILLDGVELSLADTAGFRDSDDDIEQEGVARAVKSMDTADLILYVYDDDNEQPLVHKIIPEGKMHILIRNKIDLDNHEIPESHNGPVAVSVKTGANMNQLLNEIRSCLKLDEGDENVIIARKRHLDALRTAKQYIEQAASTVNKEGSELTSELLRQALNCFDEVTGKTTADDVLGAVFSRFCIGK